MLLVLAESSFGFRLKRVTRAWKRHSSKFAYNAAAFFSKDMFFGPLVGGKGTMAPGTIIYI